MSNFSPIMERLRHEFWEDMEAQSRSQLVEMGVPEQAADLVANSLVAHFIDHWGGQSITFTKEYRRRLCEREIEIYRKFDGRNYAELAREYKMHERGMRKVIARMQERLRRQAQGAPDLFSAELTPVLHADPS